MTHNVDMQQLERSIDDSSRYPKNLVRTDEFPYALARYKDEFEDHKAKIFKAGDGAIVTWDLNPDKHGAGFRYTENPVKKSADLDDVVGSNKPDPLKRFIFLRAWNSRAPLKCSKEQMETILSCHQVMAPFLDHVISFRQRTEPHKLTSFTSEDYLSSHHELPGLAGMHRSGIQLQHCFNVLGMECDKDDGFKWKQRQVAAHHAFDLQNGRSTWIIMKGDDTIRERMQEATRASLTQNPEFPASLASTLHESLQDHLITMQWGAENWGQYIDSLEHEYNEVSKITEYGKIDDLANSILARRINDRLNLADDIIAGRINARRASTMSKSALSQTPNSISQIAKKETTNASDNTSTPSKPGLLRRLSSESTTWTGSTFPLTRRFSSGIPVESRDVVNENLDLGALVKFEGPQRLHRLANNILAASSVIDQNKRVFSDIRTRYQDLTKSPLFYLHVADETTRRFCIEHVADFARKVQRLESDLESRQSRMKTILYRTEQAGEMYNRLFQIVNTRTAEYFATTSQNSTELMQEWTVDMHQKTVSMNTITLCTLIFLPGTFVATLFSSGIITFGQEGEGGFGPLLGDWKVRPASLKLFFAICVPLDFITLCAWLVTYCSSKIRASTMQMHNAVANDVA